MQEIIQLYKEIGETPLECIKRFQGSTLKYKGIKMTYLGRLDPMAEGLLLVLTGNMRDKNKYLEMDKTYEFEVLWGFKSDTHDVLGLIEGEGKIPKNLERRISIVLKNIRMKRTQAYPAFSSRTVSGKSLFMWAREERIEEIDIPTRKIKIFEIKHIHTRFVLGKELLESIEGRVAKVQGDFRQDKIMGRWKNTLVPKENEHFLVSKFAADVSSGTYIRGLADEMGKMLDTVALAYSIKRTRVGECRI